MPDATLAKKKLEVSDGKAGMINPTVLYIWLLKLLAAELGL
ncbi:hypothetical protein [Paenibacillus wynnii]|nr:hypothetical protein [Paenibacillus wynnii]MDQ0195084.1 hypothetical protein [Paenibacillus wynnii]